MQPWLASIGYALLMNLALHSWRSLLLATLAVLLLPQAHAAEATQAAWTLTTPAGASVSFPNDRNGPAVLLFWASWCPYCQQLMPYLQSIQDEYAADHEGEVTVYAIHFRDDTDPQAYMDENGYTFTVLTDGAAVADSYGIYGTPGVLIFDRNNKQVFNLYDVVTDVDKELAREPELSNREKAARKAPAWAERISSTLDNLPADSQPD